MERDKLSALSFESKQEEETEESGATFKDKAEEIALAQQRVDVIVEFGIVLACKVTLLYASLQVL